MFYKVTNNYSSKEVLREKMNRDAATILDFAMSHFKRHFYFSLIFI